VRVWGKKQDAAMTAMPGQGQPGPEQEGISAGVKKAASELAAGLYAQRHNMPEGTPVHIGTLPGGPSALQHAAAPPKPPPGAGGADAFQQSGA